MKDTKNIKKFLKTVFARKVTVINAIIVLIFIFLAIFAPFVAPYDPDKPDFAAFLQLPSAAHVLGTDNFGRDVLSRIIYGTRVSLIIGVLAVVVACAVGTVLGMIAGYFGGWIDDVITRLMEAVRAIPQIILAMALTAVFGSGIRNLAIILGISSMAGYVRMMRGQVLTIKQADYIMAGKLQGNKDFRLMFRHILPNSISPIIVMMTQQVGSTILAEAGLSFLGLGSYKEKSWGLILHYAFYQRGVIRGYYWWYLPPIICTALAALGFMLLGYYGTQKTEGKKHV